MHLNCGDGSDLVNRSFTPVCHVLNVVLNVTCAVVTVSRRSPGSGESDLSSLGNETGASEMMRSQNATRACRSVIFFFPFAWDMLKLIIREPGVDHEIHKG